MRRRFPSLLLTACLLASGGLAVTAVADTTTVEVDGRGYYRVVVLGDAAGARTRYAAGAELPVAFYGQLGALEELSDGEARTNFDVNVFGEYNIGGDYWVVKELLEKVGYRIVSPFTCAS